MNRRRDSSDSADDPAAAITNTAATAMRRALLKTTAPQLALTLVPTCAAYAATLGMIVMAYAALGDLDSAMWWLALLYLTLLPVAIVLHAFHATQRVVKIVREGRTADHPEVRARPTLADLDSRRAWRVRTVTAPAALLAAVHLTHADWTPHLLTTAALVGWLGIDLATLLTHPARLRLYRVLTLISPTPRNSPER